MYVLPTLRPVDRSVTLIEDYWRSGPAKVLTCEAPHQIRARGAMSGAVVDPAAGTPSRRAVPAPG